MSVCILLSMLIILILVEAELPKETLILSPPKSFHNKKGTSEAVKLLQKPLVM